MKNYLLALTLMIGVASANAETAQTNEVKATAEAGWIDENLADEKAIEESVYNDSKGLDTSCRVVAISRRGRVLGSFYGRTSRYSRQCVRGILACRLFLEVNDYRRAQCYQVRRPW